MTSTAALIVEYCGSAKAWDLAANQYHVMSTLFTQGYAKDAFDAVVTNKSNVRIIDVACGAGALAIPAAELIKSSGGHVLATDISPKMIEKVKEACKAASLTNIDATVEDGQNLNLSDNHFDYGFSIFGIMLFPDMKKGFSEIFRVVKPGGKVAIVTWTSENAVADILTAVMRRYGNNDPLPFLSLSTKERLTEVLAEAGFKDIQIQPVTKVMSIPSHELFIANTATNPGFVAVRECLGVDKEKFEAEVLSVMRELYPTVPVPVPNTALIGVGTKPN